MTHYHMPPIRITYENVIKRPSEAAERKSRVVGMHKAVSIAWPCDWSRGCMPKRRKSGAEVKKMEDRSRKRGEASRKRRETMMKLLDAWEKKK